MSLRVDVALRARRRGVTLLEVMAALGILGIGAAGVIALQKVVLVSGTRAGTLAAATAVAEGWAERLRVDGVRWGAAGPLALEGTRWLRVAELAPGEVHVPAVVGDGAPSADLWGSDAVAGDGAAVVFCTHLRLTRLAPVWPELVRAEIRVAWERAHQPMDCGVDPAEVDAAPERYGAVYLVAGVLRIQPEVAP
ncbi:type IV pilus modification PilV family protein [Chondromyces apiculatus]|uniref:type IV pilus modification PilV family protein n=1 Tax=Chondromyces apiculatus TaxID=51 RepID=UPI00279638D1|nr:prepilin-type N-terminal cleavage/methylation domain-containing protein [Chondromyces apiculatus]